MIFHRFFFLWTPLFCLCLFPAVSTLGSGVRTGAFNAVGTSGLYDTGLGSGQFDTGTKSSQYDVTVVSGQYDTGVKSGQYDAGLKSGQYDTGVSSIKHGQYDTSSSMRSGQYDTSRSGQYDLLDAALPAFTWSTTTLPAAGTVATGGTSSYSYQVSTNNRSGAAVAVSPTSPSSLSGETSKYRYICTRSILIQCHIK